MPRMVTLLVKVPPPASDQTRFGASALRLESCSTPFSSRALPASTLTVSGTFWTFSEVLRASTTTSDKVGGAVSAAASAAVAWLQNKAHEQRQNDRKLRIIGSTFVILSIESPHVLHSKTAAGFRTPVDVL